MTIKQRPDGTHYREGLSARSIYELKHGRALYDCAQKAAEDANTFGSGMIRVDADGTPHHVPPHEWPL